MILLKSKRDWFRFLTVFITFLYSISFAVYLCCKLIYKWTYRWPQYIGPTAVFRSFWPPSKDYSCSYFLWLKVYVNLYDNGQIPNTSHIIHVKVLLQRKNPSKIKMMVSTTNMKDKVTSTLEDTESLFTPIN